MPAFTPNSLDDITVPAALRCAYDAELNGATMTTDCASAGDGVCDEPLACLALAASVGAASSPDIAVMKFEECVDRLAAEKRCFFGTDGADCAGSIASLFEPLQTCDKPEDCWGLLAVLGSRHFQGSAHFVGSQVRRTPCWPRSWASFSRS